MQPEISLQLSADEVLEFWGPWCSAVGLDGTSLGVTDLREYILQLAENQPGLVMHVLDWLKIRLVSSPPDSKLEAARDSLLSPDFLETLRSTSGLRR